MKIKQREKTAIINSLASGVVPKIGLHLLQVGRKLELESMVQDLLIIEDGGSTIRFVCGRFGSGKTFFLNLIKTVAVERKIVVVQADITLDRRLYSTSGHTRALYTELIRNMATRAKPEGGAMNGIVERFVTDVNKEYGDLSTGEIEKVISEKLEPLLDLTHGMNFIRVLSQYVKGYANHNDDLVNSALRWLRGEYSTKTEARQDLGVRDIIEDSHFYDMLKLWAKFLTIAGYNGLFVNLDELVVLSERLNNSQSRTKNYEVILQILNDCLQGAVENLGLCFAGTDEFIYDRRRGLHSYEALATRLADNPFATEGLVDTKGPVIKLSALSKEEIIVLLGKIAHIHALGNPEKILINDKDIYKFMLSYENKLGANRYLTTRDIVQPFVGLINILEQNPTATLDSFLQLPADKSIEQTSDDKNNELKGFTL